MIDDPDPIQLLLYVAGTAPNSVRALANVRAMCERIGAPRTVVEVVDVFAEPQRALGAGVVVTPLLVLASDSSRPSIVGTLDDVALVLATLGLEPVS